MKTWAAIAVQLLFGSLTCLIFTELIRPWIVLRTI